MFFSVVQNKGMEQWNHSWPSYSPWLLLVFLMLWSEYCFISHFNKAKTQVPMYFPVLHHSYMHDLFLLSFSPLLHSHSRIIHRSVKTRTHCAGTTLTAVWLEFWASAHTRKVEKRKCTNGGLCSDGRIRYKSKFPVNPTSSSKIPFFFPFVHCVSGKPLFSSEVFRWR